MDANVRFKGLYLAISYIPAGLLSVLGVGLLVGGRFATASPSLGVLAWLEGGDVSDLLGLRVHGLLMLLLGGLLAWGLQDFRRLTYRALVGVMAYCSFTSMLIFGGWFVYGVAWQGFWFYLTPAAICLVLLFFAPPLGADGRRIGVTTTGSDRA